MLVEVSSPWFFRSASSRTAPPTTSWKVHHAADQRSTFRTTGGIDRDVRMTSTLPVEGPNWPFRPLPAPGTDSGGGGKPPAAAAPAVAPIARQYRNFATELWSEVAIRATSSMAVCASFMAAVVELVAVATAPMFSAIC